MFTANNTINVLIGKSVSRTASVQVYDTTLASYIADGELVVLNENFVPLTAGQTIADSKSIYIAKGSGTSNPLVVSPRIDGANVLEFTGKQYVVGQEQVDFIGYNGSSGTIDAANSTTYSIRVIFKHDNHIWAEQKNVVYEEYTSDASATALEIARGFAIKFSNGLPSNKGFIKMEMVTDGTATAIGGSETLTVTKGSATITSSGTSHALVANDLVRIGSSSATAPVYKVTAVSGATITLDQPYQGSSASSVAAYEMSSISNYGLKITGVTPTFTSSMVGRYKYHKVAFDTTISNFGTTTITNSQAPSLGQGEYGQVAELEYFSLGNNGWLSARNSVPAQAQPRTDAVSGAAYDTIVIRGFDNSEFNAVSGTKAAPFNLYLFLVDGASQGTDLLAQLNPWMASCPRAFANVTI